MEANPSGEAVTAAASTVIFTEPWKRVLTNNKYLETNARTSEKNF